MRNETITNGTEIKTIAGYMIATNYNGSIVYIDEYETNEYGEAEKVGERSLTLAEIGHEMKRVDGTNHKVAWQ